ncbi:Uncharacterized protein HZ326_23815 [Fusarium oxysporum f. sp. albedinis]|nr:Uncharacterized protein HZ326_23815 [Fusarium oxysporum f. sp. albedinis]
MLTVGSGRCVPINVSANSANPASSHNKAYCTKYPQYQVLIHEIMAPARHAPLSRQIIWFNNSNFRLVIFSLFPRCYSQTI